MTKKRFHWDWKTGRMKDTYSDFQATKDMRLIEQSINDACRSYEKQITKLKDENEQLKQELQNGFELNWTQNRVEFDKDKLYIKDINTEVCLNGTNLSIRVHIPSSNEYHQFKYKVTGRSLMKEFIEEYNSKGDDKNG